MLTDSLLLLTLLSSFILCSAVNEQSLIDKGPLQRFDSTVVWVYITNRPANVTHGNVTFVPTPGVPDVWTKAIFFPKVDVFSRLEFNASMKILLFIANS